MNKIKSMLLSVGALVIGAGLSMSAVQAETVKIAYIAGLSGPFAATGQDALRELRTSVKIFLDGREVAGEKLEIELIPLDGKLNPKESLVQLQNAISQGASYLFHTSGSSVAHALIGALEKHNKRNPDKRMLYLNFGAVDPALTGAKCSFWHFLMDANADMKVSAITGVIKMNPDIKKVYIIGQDYSFGKAFSAAAKKFLSEKRPDIEIVGDELHPIGKVKDFTPYAQKIQRSGADAIMTGNWGSDMINLAKSVKEIGIDANIYALYAYGPGVSAVIGETGKDRVFIVSEGHMNPPGTDAWAEYTDAFLKKYPGRNLTLSRAVHGVQMLAEAFVKAGNTDPFQVAKALEGLEFTTLGGDKIIMRAEDHQLQMPLRIMVHTDEGVKYDYDKSGFGVVTSATIPLEDSMIKTSCKMKRPS